MADIKFSEFPKANQSKDSDEIAILQDGVNKMIASPVLESKIINKTVSRVIEQGGASLNVINLKGVVPTYADLATITPTPELNDAYQVEADGLVYVYTENGFQSDGEGFVVQPEPTGVVEEGNTQAVSGGEVFEKLQTKADITKTTITNFYDIEFVQGGSTAGSLNDSPIRIRFKNDIFFEKTAIVTISANSGFKMFVKRSSTTPVLGSNQNAPNPTTFTVQAGQYLSVVLGRTSDEPILPSDEHGFTMSSQVTGNVVYSDELQELETDVNLRVNEIDNRMDLFGIPTSAKLYQNSFPSMSTGGVASFIDDDGKSELYTILYPFIKLHNIPFGAAIITDRMDDAGTITSEQLLEMHSDPLIEIMSHTHTHQNLSGLTDVQVKDQCAISKTILANKYGIRTEALVLPYGGWNDSSLRIASEYYNSVYHFGVVPRPYATFDNIVNLKIYRNSISLSSNIATLKQRIDDAVANNGWIIFTTHVANDGYWDETTMDALEDLVSYIRSKSMKIMKPTEAFRIFGNFVEADNGFKISANGTIKPADV